ncbi:MAG: exo-alpha-sialidase [Ginsengibacter sp.]
MKGLIIIFFSLLLFVACKQQHQSNHTGVILIANGRMPSITKDGMEVIHIVYGTGDSIMYTSSNNKGISFSSPELIDSLKGLVAYATRGPQIAATRGGVAIIAVNKSGDIFSYVKDQTNRWIKTQRVNDADTIDKEGFLGLSSDNENNLFAIWTDLRNDHRNKIFGARSMDGGKSWQKNILVYASPDHNICECCKPSVVMKKNNVFVMFRNFLDGNRDLYMIQSANKGETFGKAQKLGKGSWALNGCPMDGGSLALNDKGSVQTVWRRQSKIYSCEPGGEEKIIGEGRGCGIETIGNKNIYAWSENGNIICLLPDGSTRTIGVGSLPLLKSVSGNEVIFIWANDTRIESYVLHL